MLEVLGRHSSQDLVNFVIDTILLQVFEESRGSIAREVVENGNVFILQENLFVLLGVDDGLLGEYLADLK